jgi:hypothetical protein
MGGIVKIARSVVSAPVKIARSAVRNPVKIIPAAVGIGTGNPLLAGLAAAGTTAVSGGNRSSILRSGVTAGLGAYAGNKLGGMVGESLSAGSSGVALGTLERIGTGLGTAVVQDMERRLVLERQQKIDAYTREMKALELPPPSFEEMRSRAVEATRKAFEENGVFLKPSSAVEATEATRKAFEKEEVFLKPSPAAREATPIEEEKDYERRLPHRYFLDAIRKSNRPRYGNRLWKRLVKYEPRYG